MRYCLLKAGNEWYRNRTKFLSVAAGAGEVVNQFLGFEEITYMQEMSTDVCTNATIGETKQLIDTRDNNNKYWISKLKDGNCWMTQNLALDLSTSKALTNIDSDVSSSGYTPPANTQTGTIAKFPSSSDFTFSYNPGKYVYITPTTSNSCGTSGIKGLSQCTSKGWTNVAAMLSSNNPNQSTPLLNSVYDAHYLAGNYYSYTVATAGYTTASGDAPNSICPKGWQLPTSNSTTASKSFGYLLDSLTVAQITASPYYFVYGGAVNSSSLTSAGSNGYYWSSTASSSAYAYYLDFATSVLPSYSYDRYYGYSVRCVAK